MDSAFHTLQLLFSRRLMTVAAVGGPQEAAHWAGSLDLQQALTEGND